MNAPVVQRRTPLAVQAAQASFWAPVVVAFVSFLARENLKGMPKVAMIFSLGSGIIILFGFICAIMGLLGIRTHGASGILGRAIFGLIMNGACILLLVSIVGSMMLARKPLVVRPPPGFVDFPEAKSKASLLHAFIKGDRTDAEPDFVILVEQLPGAMQRGKDYARELEGRQGVTRQKDVWQKHAIDVIRVEERIEGITYITYNAMLPVFPKAIKVSVGGPGQREAEITKHLRTALDGVNGYSNW